MAKARRLGDFVGNLFGRFRHGNNSKMQKTSGANRTPSSSSIGSCAHGRVVKRPPGRALGTEKTWKALTDEGKRPLGVREPLDPFGRKWTPQFLSTWTLISCCRMNLQNSRRGAAGGPSVMTTEHLKILLDSAPGPLSSHVVESQKTFSCVRVGRMTALLKVDGGVRSNVVGEEAEGATLPFQYALSTRAGTECAAHIVQH